MWLICCFEMTYFLYAINVMHIYLPLAGMASKDQATPTTGHMPYDQWMTQSFADQIPDISCNSSNVPQPQPQLGAETFWTKYRRRRKRVMGSALLRHHYACDTLEGRWRRNDRSWLDSHFQNLSLLNTAHFFVLIFYNYLLHFIQHVSSVLFLYF